ncbi:MFS transporter [Buttiauxella gaviniae]|uniref:MFS transporter n=1 Tax=Buttiauxella gaviniae TaxID=82990 RepID=A0ABV3NVJ0_9ENTR
MSDKVAPTPTKNYDSVDTDSLNKKGYIKFLVSLSTNFMFLLALYNAVISVFLPNQVQQITDATGGDKVAALAIIMTLVSVFTFFDQPLAGALSDRTRSRFGRRTPWIIGGTFIGGMALAMVAHQTTIIGLTIFWVIAAVALNMAQGPLSASLPDRVEEKRRGVASGFIGAAQTGGGTLGIIFGGWIANRDLASGFYFFAIGIFIVSLASCLMNREQSSEDMPREPLVWKKFFTQFWVSPKKYPDFGWAFAGRFVMFLGYQLIVNYQLYILRDYINLSKTDSNVLIGVMASIQLVSLIISAVVSGYLSDKFQVRKPFVIISSIIMASAYLFPLLMQNEISMLIMAGIIGLGYGCYMSIDMALMTQVLPEKGANAGKDMGVLNIANKCPQMIVTPLGAFILSVTTSYSAVFIFAIVMVILSACLIAPIKSVK